MDGYITVKSDATAEYSEKRSKFIAVLHPVCSEEEALAFISEIKAKHRDARHNVFAYSLYDNGLMRFSDDGEPHGTAGKPVLDALSGAGITNAVIVVTRYFGGVLLGTGGLVRAYSKAATDAVAAASKMKMISCTVFCTSLEYADHGKLVSLITGCGGVIKDTDFGTSIKLTYYLERSLQEGFLKKLKETFAARLEAEITGQNLCPFPDI